MVRNDLGLKSLKRHAVHHLTPALRQKRFQRSKKLLARLAVGPENNIQFSDEKIFTVEEAHNSQNDRVLAPSSKSISDEESSLIGCKNPIFDGMGRCVRQLSDTSNFCHPEVKIDSKAYRELILESEVKHAGSKLFKNEDRIFQQDSAPTHASKATQSWLRAENIEFISKEEWPPSSPDLNPLDYSIWGTLQTRACAKPHKSLKSLRNALIREWQKMPQEELRDSIHQFKGRLRAVVKKKGGYIE